MTPGLIAPREAARLLGISYSTLKQWIYKGKLRTKVTPGGHHRIPESELDRYLYVRRQRSAIPERRSGYRRISGRNQLIGRVRALRVEGLMAQVGIAIGGQSINAIITADAAREMRLQIGDEVAALIKSTEVMVLRPEAAAEPSVAARPKAAGGTRRSREL